MTLVQDSKDVQLQQDIISINEHNTLYININSSSILKQHKSISSSSISIHRFRDVTEIFRTFVRIR